MALQYNSRGRPVVRIGNWLEEAALMDSLGLEDNSQTRDPAGRATNKTSITRILPVDDYDPNHHFVTTTKSVHRREIHLEHGAVDASGDPAKMPTSLPRRQDIIRSSARAQAEILYQQRQAELNASISKAEEEKRKIANANGAQNVDDCVDASNPFAHRAPLNRQREMVLNRPPVVPDPLNTPAITVYSMDTRLVASQASKGPSAFGRNSNFTKPIEEYTASVWR